MFKAAKTALETKKQADFFYFIGSFPFLAGAAIVNPKNASVFVSNACSPALDWWLPPYFLDLPWAVPYIRFSTD